MVRRNTKQRQVVYDCIMESGHITSDELIKRILSSHDDISLATIYRNISLLIEENMIKRVMLGEIEVLETVKKDHFHFKCTKCGSIIDIDESEITVTPNASSFKETSITGCDILLYGICSKCQQKRG